MPDTGHVDIPSLEGRVAPEEWQLRVDLAAAYRLIARFGWDDLLFTHSSARVSGPEHHFLINPFGLRFDEITASSLVKIDLDGEKVLPSAYEVIKPAFTIHSAIHMSREDAICVIHTHTTAGMAVAAQKHGLLMLNQKSMAFHDRLGYHDYEGVADDLDERERLARDLGPHRACILRNHGLLTCGASVAQAFLTMRRLQHACELQLAALAGGAEIVVPSDETCEHTARQLDKSGAADSTATRSNWAALRRLLDDEDPGYAT